MSQPSAATVWTDRLPAVSNKVRGALLAAILVVTLIGIYEIVQILLAPAHHLGESMQGISLALVSLTTLGLLGGLIALSGVPSSLVSYRDTERKIQRACRSG